MVLEVFMIKTIDFSKTVYELCKEDPQVIEIMKELGFEQITNPASLNTVGRFMTLPKGAAMRGIDLERIKDEFIKRGYELKAD
jgi:hypothetical protein